MLAQALQEEGSSDAPFDFPLEDSCEHQHDDDQMEESGEHMMMLSDGEKDQDVLENEPWSVATSAAFLQLPHLEEVAEAVLSAQQQHAAELLPLGSGVQQAVAKKVKVWRCGRTCRPHSDLFGGLPNTLLLACPQLLGCG